MDLREYLFRNRMKIKDFAAQLDLSAYHIGRYINKYHRLSPRIGRQIEKLTNGQVTEKEILEYNPIKTSRLSKDIDERDRL